MKGSTTPRVGAAVGGVLVLVGVGAYVASAFASVTALIPALFGVVFVALGLVGTRMDRPVLAVYGTGLLAVAGVLGSLRGVPEIVALVTGGEPESTIAATTQGAMILGCLALIGVVVLDILEAR